MTGGQQMDGPFDPIQICKQLLAENVKKVYLISDDIDKFNNLKIPSEIKIFHRKDYIDAQTDLKNKGVTAIVYDQTCAAEKEDEEKEGCILTLIKECLLIISFVKDAVIVVFNLIAFQ